MLTINVIFFIIAVCSGANISTSTDTSASSITTAKLKRRTVDPGRDTHNNQELFRGTQSTPRISSPRDINSGPLAHYTNAKASDTQRVPNHESGSHAYGSVPKRPLSYTSSPFHQTESRQGSPLAAYFNVLNNPSTFKVATSAEKPLDKSIVSLQKLQDAPGYGAFHRDKSIELSDFSDFEFPTYSSISKIISQGIQNGASSPARIQVPVYKGSYPLRKITEHARVYSPGLSTASNVAPLFHSSEKIRQSSKQSDEVTVDVNGKKISVPVIQLQSTPDISAVFPVFESQPFLLSADYSTESDLGFNFGSGPKLNMALQSKNASPFSSPLSSFQGQVIPIQTAGSTPQFPQYKGASIQVYPVSNGVPKLQGNYEPLYSQPQLHFGKEHGGQPANAQQNTGHLSISTEDILEDVEIVNKKNPEPHSPQPDDDEEEERYKNPEKEYEHDSEDDDAERESGKYFKEPPTIESDFKPSTSYPFKEYDEKFGRYTAQVDEDSDDKPYSGYKNPPSNNEEEEDTSSEYVESPRPSSHDSYEEENEEEEESRTNEKQEETDKSPYETEPKQSKYYGKDFEQEFEESYRKELPKQKYVHVKEVPEIESYDDPKPSKQHSKHDNRSRVNHEETKSQEARISRKNQKVPKTSYKDSTAYGSNIFVKKTPKVVYEEFFRYKNPETGKYSKRANAKTAIEKHSPAKKSSIEDNYLRASKYHKNKSAKTGSVIKYPYSSASINWKPNQNSPKQATPESNVRLLSNPGDRASFYRTSTVNGPARSLTNAEILRDLAGI